MHKLLYVSNYFESNREEAIYQSDFQSITYQLVTGSENLSTPVFHRPGPQKAL